MDSLFGNATTAKPALCPLTCGELGVVKPCKVQ